MNLCDSQALIPDTILHTLSHIFSLLPKEVPSPSLLTMRHPETQHQECQICAIPLMHKEVTGQIAFVFLARGLLCGAG